MKKLTHVLVVFVALLLVGCSASAPRVSKESFSQVKRIGVVSQIGSELTNQYVGLTVFNNTREAVDVSSWSLDKVYEEQLAASIKQVTKTEVVVLGSMRKNFSSVNSLRGPSEAPTYLHPSFETIADSTRAACQAEKLDAIIVVAKWASPDTISSTNQRLEGVGVYSGRGRNRAHVKAKLVYMGLQFLEGRCSASTVEVCGNCFWRSKRYIRNCTDLPRPRRKTVRPMVDV